MKFLISLLFILASSTVFAAKTEKVEATFSEARIVAPMKSTTVTAGYVKIKNETNAKIEVNVIEVKPFKAAEMHESYDKDGKMGMRKIEKLEIAANQTAELKPGGHHIMLFDASREVKVGEKLTVKFTVNGKPVEQAFEVQARANKKSEHDHH